MRTRACVLMLTMMATLTLAVGCGSDDLAGRTDGARLGSPDGAPALDLDGRRDASILADVELDSKGDDFGGPQSDAGVPTTDGASGDGTPSTPDGPADVDASTPSGSAQVKSFTLINADSDKPIAGYDPLKNGSALDLAKLPTRNLNIRANASGTAPITFDLAGAESHKITENVAPYALKGDTAGDYAGWTPAVGSYTLSARGPQGRSYQIAFTVADGSPSPGGNDGRLWIEVESVAPTGSWKLETAKTPYSDKGYYIWDGADTFGTPGKGLLRYTFSIDIAGRYTMHIRNRRDKEGLCKAEADDRCNDIFSRVDGSTWTKTLLKGAWGAWIWNTTLEPTTHSFIPATYQLGKGQHVLELSGRSKGIKIDAIRLTLDGKTPLTNKPAGTSGKSPISFGAGRVAFSHDGNQHDPDDWGAMALNFALWWAAGLQDRIVHIDHSDHLGDNSAKMHQEMIDTAAGASRFKIDQRVIFDAQTELAAAIANFKGQASTASASDPIWYILSGPMEVPWRCINAVDPAKRKFIHVISHSTWNENHADTAEMTHRWSDIKALGVIAHDIRDQNNSNGDNDFNTPRDRWFWMRDSTHEPYRWVFGRDGFSNKFDVSDAGMSYWLLTGGPQGGDDRAGWPETKNLLEAAVAK